ncbi:hypothetical protein L2E82_19153 [Cichorium intybus]|uniref:Uncharacterized protein n=1 Tax=Cichorium intybus TaxID=13427 RepID=A0ACB9FCP0_CICIN|nr:hypothetical protein L2E82_19153 [Cichorium intybus]
MRSEAFGFNILFIPFVPTLSISVPIIQITFDCTKDIRSLQIASSSFLRIGLSPSDGVCVSQGLYEDLVILSKLVGGDLLETVTAHAVIGWLIKPGLAQVWEYTDPKHEKRPYVLKWQF